MPKFVRCMEGHAFDSEQSEVCPTCGASVWRGPNDGKPKQGHRGPDSSTDDGPRPGGSKWLLAGGGGIAVLAAAAVGYLLLRPVAPPPAPQPVVHSQPATPEKSAPPAVAPQMPPPQPPDAAPQKPIPATGGQMAQVPPPATAQPTSTATVTPATPPPLGGDGPTAQPPPQSLASVAPVPPVSTSPPPAAPTNPVSPGDPVSPPPVPQIAPWTLTPPSASAPPSPAPAPPPVIATEVIGRAHFSQHSLAILDVEGASVRLQGVLSQSERQRDAAERFLSYITQGTNQVRCEPAGDKTYECRAVRTDVRIGAGMIANGFAGADPAAPAEFQHWEDDARRAHRGIWGAQANR